MKKLIYAAVLGATPGVLFAQEKPNPIQDEIDIATIETNFERGVANGNPDRGLFVADGPQLEISATEKDKKGTLSWAFSAGSSTNKGSFQSGTFLLQLSTSFDGSEDEASLFGLKGFATGTDLSLGYTHFWGRIGDPLADPEGSKIYADEEKKAVRNCIKKNLGADPKDINKLCNPDNAENPEFEGSRSSFLEKYNPEGFEKVYGLHFPEKSIRFLGGKVTGNQTKFSYLDTVAFSEKKESKFGYEATAFGGWLLTGSPTAISASVTASRKYTANPAITVCQPFAAPQTRCITGANGAPAKEKALIVASELRHGFDLGKNGSARMAVAPEVSYDIENKAFAIDVPLYFFPDKDGALRGGVRGGYTNTKDATGKREGEFQIGLFFGIPFKLF